MPQVLPQVPGCLDQLFLAAAMAPPPRHALQVLATSLAALLLTTQEVGAPSLNFIGKAEFRQQESVLTQAGGRNGTLGGFSGLTYERQTDEWWMISDRGGKLWKIGVDLSSGRLEGRAGIRWLSAQQIHTDRVESRCPFRQCTTLDAEGIAAGCLADESTLLVSTEGPADVLAVSETALLLLPDPADLSGGERVWAPCMGSVCPALLRDNKMIESLSCGVDAATQRRVVFAGFEDPMIADGAMPTATTGGSSRIFALDPTNGELLYTARYELSPNAFADSDATGLVDIEAIPSPASSAPAPPPGGDVGENCGPAGTCGAHSVCRGSCPPPGPCASVACVCRDGYSGDGYTCEPAVQTTLLSMERSYSPSRGWAIRVYQTDPLSSVPDGSSCTRGFDMNPVPTQSIRRCL